MDLDCYWTYRQINSWCYLSSAERNTLVVEKLLNSLVKDYEKYTFNRWCIWYPYEWWLLKVKHTSSPCLWEKHYRKKTIQYIKDRTECFDDYFPGRRERSAYKYEFEDNPWSLLQIYRSMSLRLTWYRSESETVLTRSSGHKIE